MSTKEIKTNNIGVIKRYAKYGVILGIVLTLVIGLLWPTENKIFNVEMSIKDYGKIIIELDGNEAPITVNNFINLVKEKYYDGLTFHRIIDGFMIQGGDKGGDGVSNDGEKTIKGEFSSNGVENNIKHERGVISMARSNDPDSASTQFFIMHETTPSLDGNYAAFGKVIDGMDIIDKIVEKTASLGGDNGMIETDNQPIIEYVKLIENK